MKFLAIKNWRDFQHYRDRNVPWVKLYAAVLDDADFLALAEVTQAQLMKLWALVARLGHPLPNDAKLLARRINTHRVRLAELLASGMIYETDNAAEGTDARPASSASLDKTQTDARPSRAGARGRGELEERGERKKLPPPHPRAGEDAGPDERLPDDCRTAYDALTRASRNPVAWHAEISATLDGMHGPAVLPAVLSLALRDMHVAGAEPTGRSLRGFLRKAAIVPAVNGSGEALTESQKFLQGVP